MFQELVISITLMLLDFIHRYPPKVCNRVWLTFGVRPEFYPAQSLGTKIYFNDFGVRPWISAGVVKINFQV